MNSWLPGSNDGHAKLAFLTLMIFFFVKIAIIFAVLFTKGELALDVGKLDDWIYGLLGLFGGLLTGRRAQQTVSTEGGDVNVTEVPAE